MAFSAHAWGHDAGTYTGKEMRQLIEALATRGDQLIAGVRTGLKVVQQTVPANTVRVSAGQAIVKATGAGLFGGYHVPNDAFVTSPTITPTSGNPRIDRVIIRVTAGVPSVEIVEGTPAGSPSLPAITGDNYLELAQITIPASTSNITTAMIDDVRVFRGEWAYPWGLQGAAERSAAHNGISTSVDLTDLSVTQLYAANRQLKITGYVMVQQISSPGTVQLALKEGATNLQLANLVLGASETGFLHVVRRVVLGASGTHTYKLAMSTNAGTVNAHGSDFPGTLLIEDLGPAGPPD